VPLNQAVDAAAEYSIDVLEEERTAPGLLHQKLSKVMAAEAFGIRDSIVLKAIECHTTLKADANDIELILFVADKLTMDAPDSKPVIAGILKGLDQSLAHAAFSYINYSLENRDTLIVLHPWMLEAYED
jgi:HD superfamily phosphohydrolase YqeK